MIKPTYTIFYSWQSDLPKETNLNAIRQAFRDSFNLLEDEIVETHIILDEATRETSGSPNIPATIFKKIESCDIFACDLTTINQDSLTRKTPNPNVLIELGFAIATIGWDRIILLYNKNFGKFPQDLPFDVDRHRITTFSIKDRTDKAGKKELSSILKIAINQIILESPLKPFERKIESSAEKKRRLDVANLVSILNTINIPTFDLFLEDFPLYIIKKIFYFKNLFFERFESSEFHIYDEKLLKILTDLKENWGLSLSFYRHYDTDNETGYKFYIPFDEFTSKEAEEDYNQLMIIGANLSRNFKDLLSYVRHNYLEIDLYETSKFAGESYKKDME